MCKGLEMDCRFEISCIEVHKYQAEAPGHRLFVCAKVCYLWTLK
ncbi:hypothetical protein HMPREF1990_01721 [Porphyromonas gingivalis W4087]|nr:hypothetical protein HMPREF1990_01721 [Porphyromonas gingivalis W4087]